MKRLFIFILFIFIITVNIFSDGKIIYKSIYVDEWGKGENLVELIVILPGMLSGVRYEKKIEDNLSFSALIFYNMAGNISSSGGRIEGNFYIHNHALNSFFIGPFLSLYNLNGSDRTGLFFGSGINVGYRWIIDNFYTVTPRMTVQYGIGPESEENIRAGASGFSYGIGLSGGIVF